MVIGEVIMSQHTPTGIAGGDNILAGVGLPHGQTTLVIGGPASGKQPFSSNSFG
jgi:KaiC/GvpD/RAD55 family RecA-like ATPase